METSILEKDKDIRLPHFTVLKASAGSGKTHALTKRFVQFLISDRIPRNTLRNILAITFSNNAAKEMKERILLWLKSIYLLDPSKSQELTQIISLDKEEELSKKSEGLIDEILENYTDFQVKTIDSFMTAIFKSSAIDLGFHPDFDILMSNDSLMEYAFDLFLRKVKEGTEEDRLLGEVITIILENKRKDSSYPWDPSKPIRDEIKKIYRKLALMEKDVKIEDHLLDMENVKKQIREQVEKIEEMIKKSGILRSKNSTFNEILSFVREGRFADLIGKGLKRAPINMPPSKFSSKLKAESSKLKLETRNSKLETEWDWYDQIFQEWENLVDLIRQYTYYYSTTYYNPYLKAYEALKETIERIKKQQGKVFIEDINKKLAQYLDNEIVPDVYFKIGETIFHYLIDEFQDTSPIQWKNLYPLIENSLSQGGSLFIVGDTKQAIYGFREADYSIMKRFEAETPFPSAEHNVKELDTNYRSLTKILEFNEKVFKEIVVNTAYKDAAERSGLIEYNQNAKQGNESMGYVEVTCFGKNDEAPAEKTRIQDLVQELLKRGYRYGDIAILTPENDNVVQVTTWLNEKDIPFISYSSLDIRRRNITGEIVSLLNFLDSPLDDLSFATFILGEIFNKVLQSPSSPFWKRGVRGDLASLEKTPSHYPPLEKGGWGDLGDFQRKFQEFFFRNRENAPLYKAFQEEFKDIWEYYFEALFKSAGYLPLYDLVTEIFSVFKVFEVFNDEEATLAKILEVIKNFEDTGKNNLKDFIDFVAELGDESQWNIDVPKGIDAVRVMTIHKAKGLGFPVVIALLYGEKLNKGFTYITQEDEDGVLLLKINKDISQSDPSFSKLYREEEIKAQVNGLNSLYVGFTRAEAEMYVIGVKGEKDKYPFELLPVEGYSPSHKPDKIHKEMEVIPEFLPLHHHHSQIKVPFNTHEMMNFEEKKRGDFIHRVLYFIDYVKEDFERVLEDIVKRVATESRDAYYPEEEVKRTLLEFLKNEEIREYFAQKAGREIKKEQDFSDRKGRLFRMDRVIIDRDKITVMDYKTGKDKKIEEEEYKAQMKNYMNILKDVFPERRIEGVLAYIDLKTLSVVRCP